MLFGNSSIITNKNKTVLYVNMENMDFLPPASFSRARLTRPSIYTVDVYHSQGGYTEKPNTRGIDKDSKKTSAKNSLESPTECGYKCVCLNARSIVNKRNELNIMVEDIDPHIIGITESWATPDISDAELGMTGYVIFRKDRLGRRGGGVILYIKESIQAYEIKLEK